VLGSYSAGGSDCRRWKTLVVNLLSGVQYNDWTRPAQALIRLDCSALEGTAAASRDGRSFNEVIFRPRGNKRDRGLDLDGLIGSCVYYARPLAGTD